MTSPRRLPRERATSPRSVAAVLAARIAGFEAPRVAATGSPAWSEPGDLSPGGSAWGAASGAYALAPCARRRGSAAARHRRACRSAPRRLLMQCGAREKGVPEPRGTPCRVRAGRRRARRAGFLMEWLEGETLGARIVKAPALEDIRAPDPGASNAARSWHASTRSIVGGGGARGQISTSVEPEPSFVEQMLGALPRLRHARSR